MKIFVLNFFHTFLSGFKIKLKNILIQLKNKLTKFDENLVMMELEIDGEILICVDISVMHQLFEIFNLINLRSKSLVVINLNLNFELTTFLIHFSHQ